MHRKAHPHPWRGLNPASLAIETNGEIVTQEPRFRAKSAPISPRLRLLPSDHLESFEGSLATRFTKNA
jgi:hypothetical protein